MKNTISLVAHTKAEERRRLHEQRIERYIQAKLAFAYTYPLNPLALSEKDADRLRNATFEEKETYYLAATRRTKIIVLFVGVLFVGFSLYRQFVPAPVPPEPPKPTFESAGAVQSIQLQSTTFSTDTTVTTTTGIFQVRGGVSASWGDTAQIKRESEGSGVKPSLCIESKIKSKCYPIL